MSVLIKFINNKEISRTNYNSTQEANKYGRSWLREAITSDEYDDDYHFQVEN